MTTPDTKAIRAKAKMWHLPSGIADDILALCDALDELRTEVKTLRRQAETLKEGWRFSDEGRIEAEAESERLRAELAWYGEQSRLARIIHTEGDSGRHALQADGGHRARAALAQEGGE